ncbi:hypothetical protein [Sciscionella sediminilitoris]|uniref:hypothetical protein n=1 Tax=Sciscionella sediminilitoris TaxID=1445613 RepID=UPI0004DFB249|nr:hypothetical protein [Sciscionella sp. SE31]
MTAATALRRLNAFTVAPGASGGELAVSYGAATIGLFGCLALGLTEQYGPVQLIVLLVLGFDLFGGAVVNATPAAKRRFHTSGKPLRHIGFVAVHIHPFVLAALFPGFTWTAAALVYLVTLAAAVLTGLAPAELRAPLGFATAGIAITVFVLLPGIPAALAWIAPLLVVKLILGHMQS